MMYKDDAFMRGWHTMNIQHRERAAEIARVRAELKAKLETALLIAKLQRMGKA
jgi:hypothetical protein